MNLFSNIYLIIFLPLISALACLLFKKKVSSFLIALTTILISLFLSLKILPEILDHKKIINDFELSPISIGLEFSLDSLGVFFLLLTLFIKLIILLYYRRDIDQLLKSGNNQIFYSVFLLNLFSLVGIFTTNNILNLFLFIEIYSFTFLASFAISKSSYLSKLRFRYYCFAVTAKLIILFCFLIIFLTLGETNLDKIITSIPILAEINPEFVAIIFTLLCLAIISNFFPFWLYFKKIHNAELIADFLAFDTLFIKTNIGIYLTLRIIYSLFGRNYSFVNLPFDKISFFIAIGLILYSALKLANQKHLKSIASYLCLNNFGFIIAAIAINKIESLQAAFFYLINFSLINLFIFIFATFLRRKYKTSSIIKLAKIKQEDFWLTLPLKIIIFFIAGFPLTILFHANWHLALASMDLGYGFLILFAMLFSSLIQIKLATKLITSFYFDQFKSNQDDFNQTEFLKKNHSFYLISFWIIISTIIYLSLAGLNLNQLTLQIAKYITSI
jgi:multicomponent Na+:H+ antiporter subunit D